MTIKMMDMKRVYIWKGFCARVALVLWVAMGLLHGDCNAQGGEFLGVRVDTAAKEAGLFIGCMTEEGRAETPLFRRTVNVVANLKTTVNVVSLGYHELYVNGKKVGDRVLQPAVSQLDRRALEVSYEITPYLHDGDNEIMLWIGQGWGRIYCKEAAVKAEIVQGGHIVAVTDGSWETAPSGYSYTGSWQPLQFGGERYDARVEPEWRPATVVDAGKILVSRQEFEGNRIIDTVAPVWLFPTGEGEVTIDFGRVVTGWFQAEFGTMDAGHEVSMDYLDHREAEPPHTERDVYVAKGRGEERFTNRFHYHAFRYVRVKGGEVKMARALQISALDDETAATFECSDPRLNAVHYLVKNTLKCLTLNGYMVDCPHLERMGYGGDGNSSTMTLQTLYDVRTTYHNWLTAWEDAMDSVGDLPYVAPAYHTGGGPYWSGFIVKAPWRTYLNYDDRSLIDRHYDAMKRWLEFVEHHSVDEILQPWPDDARRMWFLGDWLAPEGVDVKGESVLHVTSCFISECLGDMVRMAQLTGRSHDARIFAERRKRLNQAIHNHFYHTESRSFANGTPLDQAYALLTGVPPDAATRKAVTEQLVEDCYGRYKAHIAVGLVGVPVFTEWAICERQSNLMATLLRQPDYPGYLYMIENGATTTWESWNGDRSRVHNCYNGIGIWFYQALAGIRPDPEAPGYRHFYVDPQPVEGVTWVKAVKPTPYGTIRVEIHDNVLRLTVPENSVATVFPGKPWQRTIKAGEWEFRFK